MHWIPRVGPPAAVVIPSCASVSWSPCWKGWRGSRHPGEKNVVRVRCLVERLNSEPPNLDSKPADHEHISGRSMETPPDLRTPRMPSLPFGNQLRIDRSCATPSTIRVTNARWSPRMLSARRGDRAAGRGCERGHPESTGGFCGHDMRQYGARTAGPCARLAPDHGYPREHASIDLRFIQTIVRIATTCAAGFDRGISPEPETASPR